jgi:hypothetical protein
MQDRQDNASRYECIMVASSPNLNILLILPILLFFSIYLIYPVYLAYPVIFFLSILSTLQPVIA